MLQENVIIELYNIFLKKLKQYDIMNNKLVKAKKNYKCDICEKTILKGTKYNYQSNKVPVYCESEKQIGIEYLTFRNCNNCVIEIEQTNKEFEELIETDEYKYQEAMQEHRYP